MGTPRRILIIKLGSIGDVVHTLPALADLKKALPSAEIDWLVEPKSRIILEGNRHLRTVIELDTHRWRREWSGDALRELGQMVSALRARKYDLAFDFQGLWKSAALGYFSGARRFIGFERRTLKEPGCHIFYSERIVPHRQAVHVIDIYKELLQGFRTDSTVHEFDLPSSQLDEHYIAEQLAVRKIGDFVIVNPGGGWDTKNWEPRNYGLLHNKLSESTGLTTVLTYGPGEEELVEEIIRASTGPPPVTFPTTLTQFIALTRRAKLFVGGDTGPLHIAAACRTPIVGIFGPTDPARNGPFNPEDKIVWHRVPCGPCYKRSCEVYQKECLRRVQVEEVFEAALQRLKVKSALPVL
jgi:lipopolysaccharide heptosyltransferase I